MQIIKVFFKSVKSVKSVVPFFLALPVKLMDFIEAIEEALGKKAIKNMLPMQPRDVPATWADCSK